MRVDPAGQVYGYSFENNGTKGKLRPLGVRRLSAEWRMEHWSRPNRDAWQHIWILTVRRRLEGSTRIPRIRRSRCEHKEEQFNHAHRTRIVTRVVFPPVLASRNDVQRLQQHSFCEKTVLARAGHGQSVLETAIHAIEAAFAQARLVKRKAPSGKRQSQTRRFSTDPLSAPPALKPKDVGF